MSLTTLPEELIEHIFLRFNIHNQQDNDRDFESECLGTLKNLCLTSKACHRIAQPCLYRKVRIRQSQLFSFTKAIIENDSLPPLVHTLDLRVSDAGEDEAINMAAENISYLLKYMRGAQTHDVDILQRVIDRGMIPVTDVFWSSVVEVLLLRLPNADTLEINWTGGPRMTLFDQVKFEKDSPPMFRSLRHLIFVDDNRNGDAIHLNAFLSYCRLETLTVVGCNCFCLDLRDEKISCPTIQTLSVIKCPFIDKESLDGLVLVCSELKDFQYYFEELGDDDISLEVDDIFTPDDIIIALNPVRKTLHSLSITTDSLGGDEGFPSLLGFTALEHFRADCFDLADYAADDDESSSDSDESDSDLLGDHADTVDTASDTGSDWTDTDTEDTETDDSESTTSSSSSGSDTCKPILHLLPPSLKTLWIDDIASVDGGFDQELIKLANSAKESFPHLERVTLESPWDCGQLLSAFEKAGIELRIVPSGHFWHLAAGLGKYTPKVTFGEGEDQEIIAA